MNQLQEYLVREFVADYHDGLMSRRDMVRRVVYITGGVASAATLLSSLGCGPSAAPSPTAAPKPTEAAKPTVAAPAAASWFRFSISRSTRGNIRSSNSNT